MNNQTTATPKLYIGLDIHKKSWQIEMRTDVCMHRKFSMPPEPGILYEYVSKHFHDYEVSLAYEIGCCGFGAARYFINLGWNVIVASPADIKHTDKHRYQKNDKIDSHHLCTELYKNDLRPIFILTEQQEQLRSLIRQRNHIVKMLRSNKNHIKSLLLYSSITIPEQYDNPNWSKDFMQWLKDIDWPYATGKESLQSMIRMVEHLHKEYLHIGNEVRAYCRRYHHKDYYLLKSIPGIGGYLSAAILGELGNLRRFNNERELSNYIGLVPGIYQSDESSRPMGITPRCKSLLRSYIIEAAWVALRLNPQYQAYYRKHQGKNNKNIIVKIAHKLVKSMLSVIKNEKPYQINYGVQAGRGHNNKTTTLNEPHSLKLIIKSHEPTTKHGG